ncbi:hypothetical protein E4U35_004903 [Claviceps purpurea]|nr:hypothetical protein E4U38_002494 [Claviceps purpurea]KAG6142181.1 hypothetical protein E4U12_003591 [Claviceps purpurea]KAG6147237.1 hypothetical protein E4U37_008147 [Claviceps purpurea]KAG6180935.1 hypothetical protein E4U36_004430 [Claviceps purpurea]KAG6210615.1 hypothetical protein E4U35_004903 [Claviceps purpurea]
MDLSRILESSDDLPTPADRCDHCGQQRTPVPVAQHREVPRNHLIAPQTRDYPQQGERTLERTYRRSYYDPNLEYFVYSSGSSAEVSRTSNRHWADNVELCIDDKSGTHAAQVRRDKAAQASQRSRRKAIMKRLDEAEKEIQRQKDEIQTKDEKLRQKDEENERLRQQLQKQAQR